MFVAFWLSIASGQGLDVFQPVLPTSSVATEDGPGALWTNPANMAYDPDPMIGLWASLKEEGPKLSAVSFSSTWQHFGLGFHSQQRAVSEDAEVTDFGFSYVNSIALPQRVNVGFRFGWNFIAGGNNHVAYNLAASWRPLGWLGVSGVAHNVGNPDPNGIVLPRTAVGVALRPLEDTLKIGVEVSRTFVDIEETLDKANLTLRVRPTEGLYLTGAAVMSDLLNEPEFSGFSVGFEYYIDGVGTGLAMDSNPSGERGYTLFSGTQEPNETLLPVPRIVELKLHGAPPYLKRTGFFSDRRASWLDILEQAKIAGEDPSVKTVVLHLNGASLPLARATELRQAIIDLKENKKKVVAHLDGSASNIDYFVASAADQIYLHPAGSVELIGLNAELTNARRTFDMIGIEPQFVKRGMFKSSPEQYTHSEPSSSSLKQMEELLDDLSSSFISAIAEGRDQTPEQVREWVDEAPWTAAKALEAGLVDDLLYPDQLEERLADLNDGHTLPRVDLEEREVAHSPWDTQRKIAVVYILGGITRGHTTGGNFLRAATTGSKSVVDQLRQARHEDTVKAVVLRVDSPGGSAFASDEIYREVERLKKSGKPIIVSMGGVAASGGYYVAANADHIFAEPSTITGSIGVFTGKFSQTNLFETLGITQTAISRGKNANLYSSATPWSTEQIDKVQEGVDAIYEQFKQRVADGRDMDMDAVQEVAQGRVWSGTSAMEVGLVDEMGGLLDAIDFAKKAANISEHRVVDVINYRDQPSMSLLSSLSADVAAHVQPFISTNAREHHWTADAKELLSPVSRWSWLLTEPDTVWALDPALLSLDPK